MRTASRPTGRSSACRSSTRAATDPETPSGWDGASGASEGGRRSLTGLRYAPGRMDLRYTEAEERSAASCARGWRTSLPALPPKPERDDWAARRAYDTGWQRMLFDAGYAGINWPKEYGGRGATPTEQLIFLEETERARAPVRRRELRRPAARRARRSSPRPPPSRRPSTCPRILRGEEVWCQGFSEPDAGSDLASLRTRADARRRRLRAQRPEDLDAASATSPTTASCSCAPTPTCPKHKGITWLICRWTRPASRSARSRRCSAPPSSARCSSTTCASRSPTASATRTTAGASPTSRSASSAAPRSSPT